MNDSLSGFSAACSTPQLQGFSWFVPCPAPRTDPRGGRADRQVKFPPLVLGCESGPLATASDDRGGQPAADFVKAGTRSAEFHESKRLDRHARSDVKGFSQRCDALRYSTYDNHPRNRQGIRCFPIDSFGSDQQAPLRKPIHASSSGKGPSGRQLPSRQHRAQLETARIADHWLDCPELGGPFFLPFDARRGGLPKLG